MSRLELENYDFVDDRVAGEFRIYDSGNASNVLTIPDGGGSVDFGSNNLDLGNNEIDGVKALNTSDPDGDGINWRFVEGGGTGDLFFQTNGGGPGDVLRLYNTGDTEISNGNLTLNGRQTINDSSRHITYNVTSGNTGAARFIQEYQHAGTTKWSLILSDDTTNSLTWRDENDDLDSLRLLADNSIQVPNGSLSVDGQTLYDAGADEIPDAAMGSIDNATLTNSSLSVAGNSVSLGGSTSVAYADLSDTGSFPITNGDLSNSIITVAGNGVSLGGSTGVAYGDLSDTGSFPIANGDLSNSSVTVNAGNQLTGGGSVSLGGSITIDINEGSGSGLDADTVDGTEAADLSADSTQGASNPTSSASSTVTLASDDSSLVEADNQTAFYRMNVTADVTSADQFDDPSVRIYSLNEDSGSGDNEAGQLWGGVTYSSTGTGQSASTDLPLIPGGFVKSTSTVENVTATFEQVNPLDNHSHSI